MITANSTSTGNRAAKKRRRWLITVFGSMWLYYRASRRIKYAERMPRNTSALTGEAWVQEKLRGDHTRFQERARMPRSTFHRLASILETRGLLKKSRTLSVSGKLMLLLYLLGQRASNRAIQDQFQIGAESVSLYVQEVVDALLVLYPEWVLW